MTGQLKRTIGFWGGVALMLGVIIGSGIFRTPPQIAANITSPGLILLLWAVGGLVCLAGAFTYAELAAMRPHSGGVYVFIREAFGSCPAFVFGWAYLVLVKPFAAGGIAFVFAEHVNILLGTTWDVRVVTTVMLLFLTVINARGVTLSTGIAGVLTFLKVLALIAIVVLCVALGKGDFSNLRASAAGGGSGGLLADPGMSMVAALVGAMALILWTYDGWADVGSVAGEVKEPQRTLPRIYIGGTLLIIVVYLAVNAVYFALVPLGELRELVKADPGLSIAPLVMERLIGPAGSTVVALIVLVSTLGSSHASIMTGARVSYAQARDGLLFRWIGHVSPKFHTPDAALFSQVGLAIVAVWFLGGFAALAESFVFTMWIFYGMGGLALIVLRVRRPTEERPFRCPGYPVVPGLFVIAAGVMTGLSVAADWRGNGRWLLVLLAGVPVYYAWRALTRRGADAGLRSTSGANEA